MTCGRCWRCGATGGDSVEGKERQLVKTAQSKVEEPPAVCCLSSPLPPPLPATSYSILIFANYAKPLQRHVDWPTSWRAGSWFVADPHFGWSTDVLHALTSHIVHMKATGCEVVRGFRAARKRHSSVIQKIRCGRRRQTREEKRCGHKGEISVPQQPLRWFDPLVFTDLWCFRTINLNPSDSDAPPATGIAANDFLVLYVWRFGVFVSFVFYFNITVQSVVRVLIPRFNQFWSLVFRITKMWMAESLWKIYD